MSDGIPAVGRRNNSVHLCLWADVQQHSIVLSTLTLAPLLFATRAFLHAHLVKKRGFLVLLMG
jgi:hypothetical protein